MRGYLLIYLWLRSYYAVLKTMCPKYGVLATLNQHPPKPQNNPKTVQGIQEKFRNNSGLSHEKPLYVKVLFAKSIDGEFVLTYAKAKLSII